MTLHVTIPRNTSKARPVAGAAPQPPCAVRVGAAPHIQPAPIVPAPRATDNGEEEPSSTCPLWGDASLTAMFRGAKPDRSALGRKRFSCEGHRKRRLRHRSAVRRAIDTVRAGTTVWFIGDSVTVQHERAFACRLWDELIVAELAGEHEPRLEVMNETSSPYFRVANPQNNWCATSSASHAVSRDSTHCGCSMPHTLHRPMHSPLTAHPTRWAQLAGPNSLGPTRWAQLVRALNYMPVLHVCGC